MSPSAAPQPYFPLLAPSPLAPFTNNTVPKLSGLCMLNFAAVESMMSMTSIDCIAVFAPFLANVICCPQLEATLVVLIGQSSKDTNLLALNNTLANHCLSDFEQILVGQGASDNLQQICSIRPSNLTAASCPVNDVNEFESTVDSSMLLAACEKIDTVNECCDQICQNAISEAARKLALKAYDFLGMDGSHAFSDHSTRVSDCEVIVHRWLASNLDPSRAKDVLRGLSNCNVNKEYGCLLPSLPSDVIFDTSSGVTFMCDLNDNIPAPWPSGFQIPSLCNKTVKIPALPAATSGQSGLHGEDFGSVWL